MADGGRVLDGIKVLDVGTWIAAPASTTVMSDFGADVIKVERPRYGDGYRHLYMMPQNPESQFNYAYTVDNRNKRSIELDLQHPRGRDLMLELVKQSDVYVTNQPVDVQKRLQLTYDDVKAANDQIIFASLTGYGETGPEAERRAFDVHAWWRRSGMMHLIRTPGEPPKSPIAGMGDHATAMSVFGVVMMALYKRERTGVGSKVTSSLMANGLWSNAINVQAALMGGSPAVSRGEYSQGELFQSRDDRWFEVMISLEENAFESLMKAISRPDLLADERYQTRESRYEHGHEIVAEILKTFRETSFHELRTGFIDNGVPFEPVYAAEDVPFDVQAHENGVLMESDPAKIGTDKVLSSPIFMDGEEKVEPQAFPELGEHTIDILKELGLDESTIEELRAEGVI